MHARLNVYTACRTSPPSPPETCTITRFMREVYGSRWCPFCHPGSSHLPYKWCGATAPHVWLAARPIQLVSPRHPRLYSCRDCSAVLQQLHNNLAVASRNQPPGAANLDSPMWAVPFPVWSVCESQIPFHDARCLAGKLLRSVAATRSFLVEFLPQKILWQDHLGTFVV